MSTTTKFLWQAVLGIALGFLAIGLVEAFDTIWAGVAVLVGWIVGYRLWRERGRRGRPPKDG